MPARRLAHLAQFLGGRVPPEHHGDPRSPFDANKARFFQQTKKNKNRARSSPPAVESGKYTASRSPSVEPGRLFSCCGGGCSLLPAAWRLRALQDRACKVPVARRRGHRRRDRCGGSDGRRHEVRGRLRRRRRHRLRDWRRRGDDGQRRRHVGRVRRRGAVDGRGAGGRAAVHRERVRGAALRAVVLGRREVGRRLRRRVRHGAAAVARAGDGRGRPDGWHRDGGPSVGGGARDRRGDAGHHSARDDAGARAAARRRRAATGRRWADGRRRDARAGGVAAELAGAAGAARRREAAIGRDLEEAVAAAVMRRRAQAGVAAGLGDARVRERLREVAPVVAARRVGGGLARGDGDLPKLVRAKADTVDNAAEPREHRLERDGAGDAVVRRGRAVPRVARELRALAREVSEGHVAAELRDARLLDVLDELRCDVRSWGTCIVRLVHVAQNRQRPRFFGGEGGVVEHAARADVGVPGGVEHLLDRLGLQEADGGQQRDVRNRVARVGADDLAELCDGAVDDLELPVDHGRHARLEVPQPLHCIHEVVDVAFFQPHGALAAVEAVGVDAALLGGREVRLPALERVALAVDRVVGEVRKQAQHRRAGLQRLLDDALVGELAVSALVAERHLVLAVAERAERDAALEVRAREHVDGEAEARVLRGVRPGVEAALHGLGLHPALVERDADDALGGVQVVEAELVRLRAALGGVARAEAVAAQGVDLRAVLVQVVVLREHLPQAVGLVHQLLRDEGGVALRLLLLCRDLLRVARAALRPLLATGGGTTALEHGGVPGVALEPDGGEDELAVAADALQVVEQLARDERRELEGDDADGGAHVEPFAQAALLLLQFDSEAHHRRRLAQERRRQVAHDVARRGLEVDEPRRHHAVAREQFERGARGRGRDGAAQRVEAGEQELAAALVLQHRARLVEDARREHRGVHVGVVAEEARQVAARVGDRRRRHVAEVLGRGLARGGAVRPNVAALAARVLVGLVERHPLHHARVVVRRAQRVGGRRSALALADGVELGFRPLRARRRLEEQPAHVDGGRRARALAAEFPARVDEEPRRRDLAALRWAARVGAPDVFARLPHVGEERVDEGAAPPDADRLVRRLPVLGGVVGGAADGLVPAVADQLREELADGVEEHVVLDARDEGLQAVGRRGGVLGLVAAAALLLPQVALLLHPEADRVVEQEPRGEAVVALVAALDAVHEGARARVRVLLGEGLEEALRLAEAVVRRRVGDGPAELDARALQHDAVAQRLDGGL
mmetsp:Transcript_46115/g.142049  ORF Transcript_46115/g.142049 Transcript_46115/m.142049 type:complete len:1259 (-) Transcript_46115:417-4193(-)